MKHIVLKCNKAGLGSFPNSKKLLIKLVLLIKLFFSNTGLIAPVENAISTNFDFCKFIW